MEDDIKPAALHVEGPSSEPTDFDPVSRPRISLTEEDSKRIRRKTDWSILTILIWVYFLQILDKTVLGFGATYGLVEDTHLTGNQYSLIGSIAPIAQLAWQPCSSWREYSHAHGLESSS